MKVITEEINYRIKRHHNSVVNYNQCLNKFAENFKNATALKYNIPIFLDANVLLRYYSISFAAREKLYEFIKKNKKRIVLSAQVQHEFIKNREESIQRFFEQVTNRIPKDFKSDVVNKMNTFLEVHKIILQDYPFVEKDITKHQKELDELLQKLNDTVEKKRKEHVDLILHDKFLDLLNECILYDSLINDEIEIVKRDFDTMKKSVNADNIDSLMNKTNFTFPGLGDIKLKPDNPYGDYIIFHEMLKYMITEKTDVIFLTFDTTKGDWMAKSKSPHLHYIQNVYANTGQILYILDADRTLGETLETNIESLVELDSEIGNDLNLENLKQLVNRHQIFQKKKLGIFTLDIIKELFLAGYSSIDEIEIDLNLALKIIVKYEKDRNTNFNTLGVLRISLRIVNPNYIHLVQDGNSTEFSDLSIRRYEKYRKMLNL